MRECAEVKECSEGLRPAQAQAQAPVSREAQRLAAETLFEMFLESGGGPLLEELRRGRY